MSNTNTGGPAFPQNTKIVLEEGQKLHRVYSDEKSIQTTKE